MSESISPGRLPEIRANAQLSRQLRGKIWDENTTDAEIDRADLLAILDAVLPDALQVVQYAKTYADGDIWRAACRLLPILGALEGGGGQEVPR